MSFNRERERERERWGSIACEAREAAAVAPALLTLPSSERLRARVKASEEVEATEATAAICIVMASWHRAIGNRREALGDRGLPGKLLESGPTIVNQHSLACGHPGTSL